MIVNGEHGVGVGEFMEMDAYVRAGRGTSGPRGDGVVMISVRSRTRIERHFACVNFTVKMLSQESALRARC